MRHAERARRGFTLLEVMVALAILGLGLTAILSAQAGAFASAITARNMSDATGLARCKMSEIEEHLLRDGFQESDEQDSGECCADEESPTIKCSWKIEKLKLPEPQYGQLDINGGLDLSGGAAAPGGASSAPGGLGMPGGANPGDIAGGLAGGLAGLAGGSDPASGGGDPMGGFAALLGPITQTIFPVLQNILETSTRRITVTVSWKEGSRDQSIEVMQWFANSSGLAGAGAQSASSSSGSGSSSSGRP